MMPIFVKWLPKPYVHVFACMFVALFGYAFHWAMGWVAIMCTVLLQPLAACLQLSHASSIVMTGIITVPVFH